MAKVEATSNLCIHNWKVFFCVDIYFNGYIADECSLTFTLYGG